MARKSRRVEQTKRKQSASGPSRADLRALAHAEKRLVAALQELHEARLRVVRRERSLYEARLRVGGAASATAVVPALIATPAADVSLANDAPAVEVAEPPVADLAPDVVAGTGDLDDTDEADAFDSANSRPPSA